jgi:GH15 family glucan-1,4-alpha-glucosidase
MALWIEDYALIGDAHTAALVGRDGSIDWYCTPRFDSQACFSALLGGPEHGRWRIAAEGPGIKVSRSYRADSLVLETRFESPEGAATVIDFMPVRSTEDRSDVIRVVRGDRGTVKMAMDLVLRFGYGHTIPWVRRRDDGFYAVAGPDAVHFRTPVAIRNERFRTVANFSISAGETLAFTLTWGYSHRPEPAAPDPLPLLEATDAWWRDWCRCEDRDNPWRDAIARSLITLKALTYRPTGGMVAAPTTSLPEQLGGVRNWDYRYCWVRDASFTIYALIISGYLEEARAWREWLLRAAAGRPDQLQIMYGIAGERRLEELELSWLPGYKDSRPARIGNAAYRQRQLDITGEILDAFHVARRHGIEVDRDAWQVQRTMLDHLESNWSAPDEGIWEIRGARRHFVHSKVMAWVAFDRAVKAVERSGLDGPVERWRALRAGVHDEVCRRGFDPTRNAFVQYYGGSALDAALLLMPLVGFLPASDARVAGTIEAVRRELSVDGFLLRYSPDAGVDGLPEGEGTFLSCTFWLADCLAMMGRREEAREIFERLLAVRNDVGLLAEEYDPRTGHQLGNFPQAFSHVMLINTAHNLDRHRDPASPRAAR